MSGSRNNTNDDIDGQQTASSRSRNVRGFELNTISEDNIVEEYPHESSTSHNVIFADDSKKHDGSDRTDAIQSKKRDGSFSHDSRRRLSSFSQSLQESRRRLSSFSQESRKVFSNISREARISLSFDIDDVGKREVLAHRRMSHLSKFSSLKKDQSEQILRRVSVLKDDFDLSVPSTRGRRESAAVVLFKAGVNRMSAKPAFHESTWDTYGGRSFLASDLEFSEVDYMDDGVDDFDDFAFFDFDNMDDIKDLPPKLAVVEEESEEMDVCDMYAPATRTKKEKSFKRGKTHLEEKTRTKKKAWFLFGKLLNRRLKKKISDKLKYQFDDQREYFTTWLSFVQIAIMITVLCLYPFAPVGKSTKTVEKDILLSREGVLYHEKLTRKVVESIWFGPSLESLILLGAKYAPCMRKDDRVYVEIDKERSRENDTGCCMQTVADGCIQRESKYCITPAVEFKAKSVCGQDPNYCAHSSISRSLWDPNTITAWPKCDKVATVIDPNDPKVRHMTCEITGRPCCINTQGQCVITTQENCQFWNGIYHADANLCSQVDCLSATCGNTFVKEDKPDQIYRLFLSLFLCAGLLHLGVILIFNLTILRDIEGYAGWLRTALIFLLSGAGGNLWSSVWLPYQVQVGESGALFGIFACVFVEGIQNWTLLERPWHYMSKLIVLLVVMIAFGLLPYIDNFAHIFGFIYGIILGFIFLPNVATTEDEEELRKEMNRYIILRVLALLIILAITVVGFILFYRIQYTHSAAIALLNCPFGEAFCENFHQGQQLEQREIEY